MLPDKMDGMRRTAYCGELRKANVGENAVVCGWVQRQRDLGSIIFIDLRDRTGIVQLAFDENTKREYFEKAFRTRAEYAVMAEGKVRLRSSVNHDIPTGDIEIEVTDYRVLAESDTPPFEIVENSQVKEELRLAYRYLDLRRPDLQQAILTRHKVMKYTREYFDNNGFIEIETPVLIKSTPEGARDYLVPSRIHKGSFFALPQSPQIYKQLLMASGFDRYMQIARCFRDEDLRADRQPEFTQIDLEMSFVDEDDVMSVNEGFIVFLFKKVLGIDISAPFRRLTYSEAMERYGTDKPDLRFGLELKDLSEIFEKCSFRVFADALEQGGEVRGIVAENAADKFPRKAVDRLTEFVKGYGAKGLAFTRVLRDGTTSSFEKFLSAENVAALHKTLHLKENDLLLIVADPDRQTVLESLGALRVEIARQLSAIDKNRFEFLWVVDFPLFEYSKEEERYVAKHHPFTSPKDGHLAFVKTDPGKALAKAYDMVLNGTEIGGGSIRINNPEVQGEMFEALGFTPEEAEKRFGFLTRAFRYGVPPHGGMAYGLDRLVMMMLQRESIRDVIAFPKVANSGELMSGAPDKVDASQLKDLHISVTDED